MHRHQQGYYDYGASADLKSRFTVETQVTLIEKWEKTKDRAWPIGLEELLGPHFYYSTS